MFSRCVCVVIIRCVCLYFELVCVSTYKVFCILVTCSWCCVYIISMTKTLCTWNNILHHFFLRTTIHHPCFSNTSYNLLYCTSELKTTYAKKHTVRYSRNLYFKSTKLKSTQFVPNSQHFLQEMSFNLMPFCPFMWLQ